MFVERPDWSRPMNATPRDKGSSITVPCRGKPCVAFRLGNEQLSYEQATPGELVWVAGRTDTWTWFKDIQRQDASWRIWESNPKICLDSLVIFEPGTARILQGEGGPGGFQNLQRSCTTRAWTSERDRAGGWEPPSFIYFILFEALLMISWTSWIKLDFRIFINWNIWNWTFDESCMYPYRILQRLSVLVSLFCAEVVSWGDPFKGRQGPSCCTLFDVICVKQQEKKGPKTTKHGCCMLLLAPQIIFIVEEPKSDTTWATPNFPTHEVLRIMTWISGLGFIVNMSCISCLVKSLQLLGILSCVLDLWVVGSRSRSLDWTKSFQRRGVTFK